MKFFNNGNKILKMEQLVIEKPENGNWKLVFDMGVIPTIASLLLLFSTVGASIFFTKNNISIFFLHRDVIEYSGANFSFENFNVVWGRNRGTIRCSNFSGSFSK